MSIQIMKTYNESFSNATTHKTEWLRVAAGPLLVWALGLLFLILTYVASGAPLDIQQIIAEQQYGAAIEEPGLLIFGKIVYQIAYYIATISLYINGYRYAVLQEGGDQWFTLNLNMRFVKMLLFSILVGFLAVIYVAISAGLIIGAHSLFAHIGIDVILGILLALYGFYLMLRIVLFPVLISIDQREPIKNSWRLMRGNVLRFFGLSLLIGLTFMLIGLIGFGLLAVLFMLSAAAGPILMGIVGLLGILFFLFFILIAWAVNSKMMGIVYLDLSANNQSQVLPSEA